MTFKLGDRVASTSSALTEFQYGDKATVLTVVDGVAWVYPDTWRKHVPCRYADRSHNGLPYLRVYSYKMEKIRTACMFK